MLVHVYMVIVIAAQLDSLPSQDSHAAVSAAITAQRAFERVRLQHMPYGPSAAPTSRCDEFIGRFCYQYGDRSGESDTPPEEHPLVIRARATLLQTLEPLVSEAPHDLWLTGTLVRYRLEQGDTTGAYAAATACQTAEWWCSALTGFVHHRTGRDQSAEIVFSAARSEMTATERCRWDDITELLGDDDRKAYMLLDCGQRVRLANTAWWLADPLHSRAGNARRSEHDQRRVLQLLLESGVNPVWLKWGDDMTELTLRFGWPSYWRRFFSSLSDLNTTNPQITQYHAEPSYHFLPTLRAMMNPLQATVNDWDLLPADSREEFAPVTMTFAPLQQQSARLLRGDSMLLISRVDRAADTVLRRNNAVVSTVALSGAPGEPAVLMQTTHSGAAFSQSTALPRFGSPSGSPMGSLVSIELSGDSVHYGRSRFAAAPLDRDQHGKSLSDLVLYQPLEAGEAELGAIAPRMTTGGAWSRGDTVGLFWETYALARGDSIEVIMMVIPDDRSFLIKVGAFLGLAPAAGRSELRWTEHTVASNFVTPRAVNFDTKSLAPGWYTVALAVSINGANPLERSTRIRIE